MGMFTPQDHVVFDDTVSTVGYISKGTYPGNWKSLVDEHSDIAMQENFTIAK